MNEDDLLISIGADLSAFNSAMGQAEKAFANLRRATQSKPVKVTLESMVADLKKDQKAFRAYEKDAKARFKGLTKVQIREFYEREQAYKASLKRQEAAQKANARKQVQTAKETTDKVIKETRRVEKTTPSRNWDFAGHRGLIDSTLVVAKYGLISQALYGVQNAFRAVISEVARFDDSQKQLEAVLGLTAEQADRGAVAIVNLGKRYGTEFKDIQEGMITLGRAGIENIDQLIDGTKGLAALSIITGDAMHYGAAAIASVISVYPELTNGTKEYTNSQGELITGTTDLINKMGAVANATRLGLEDFSTISNYALTTAKSVGLNTEAYLGLAGAMSKVGLNASTIGTSIRRLSKFTQDNSDAVTRFFNVVGKSQTDFAKELQAPDGGIEAVGKFTTRLAQMSSEEFVNATKDLDIQMKATAVTLRQIGQSQAFSEMLYQMQDVKDIMEQADVAAEGLGVRWNRLKRTLESSFDIGVAGIITDIEEALKNMEKDGVDVFDTIGKAAIEFADGAIRAIGNVIFIFGKLINYIRWAISGFSLIGSWVAKGLETLAPKKEDVDDARKLVEDLEEAKAKGETTVTNAFGFVKPIRTAIKDAKETLSDLETGFGRGQFMKDASKSMEEYAFESAKVNAETDKFLENMWETSQTIAGNFTKNMNKIRDDVDKTEKKLREFSTEDFAKGGLVAELTPEQIAIREKALIQQKLLNGEISLEQARREEIAANITKAATEYSLLQAAADKDLASGKAALEADRAREKLLGLLVKEKKLIAGEAEREARAQEKIARDTIRLERIKAEIRAQQAKFEAQGAYDLQTDYAAQEQKIDNARAEVEQLGLAYAKALEIADQEKSKIETQRILKKLMTANGKLLELEAQKAKKVAEQFKSTAEDFSDALLGGDLKGAFAGLFKDIANVFIKPLKESFSTLFGNTMRKLLGGFFDDYQAKLAEWATSGTKTAMEVGQANAVAATANQATAGDPYTAWARMAAMAATMAALGFIVGGIGGGGAGLSEAEREALGGRTEGFDDASIEGIKDALEEAQYPMLEVTNSIHRHIRSMDTNFISVARALTGTSAGLDITGASFTPEFDQTLWGAISSTQTSLLGSGLEFFGDNINDFMNNTIGSIQSFMTVLEETDYVFGLFSDSDVETTFAKLDTNVANRLSDIFKSGYESILESAVLLGFNQAEIEKAIQAVQLDIGRISFEGLSDTEIEERLKSVFSEIFSSLVVGVDGLDELTKRYAKSGEESFETLSRIAIEYEQASFAFDLIGKTFTDSVKTVTKTWTETVVTESQTGFFNLFSGISRAFTDAFSFGTGAFGGIFGGIATAVTEVVNIMTAEVQEVYTAQEQILDIVASTGGLTEFQDAMGAFMTNFYTESEQLAFMQKSLEASFTTLGLEVPKTNKEFRTLLETMDTSTEEGAYLYGQVLLLAESFAAMTDAAENLNGAMDIGPIQNIADAWLSDLSYLTNAQKTAFADSYYDIVRDFAAINEDVSLVDAARSAAEQALKTTATREEFIPYFDRYIRALEDEAQEATLNDVVVELREVVSAIRDLEDTTTRVQPTVTDVRIVE